MEKIVEESIKGLNIHGKMASARADLAQLARGKSGHNDFGKWDYMTLQDFMADINMLNLKYRINDVFIIQDGKVQLTIYDWDSENTIQFVFPYERYETPLSKTGAKQMQDVQYDGGLITYWRRYLYTAAYGITETDKIDQMDNSKLEVVNPSAYEQKKAEQIMALESYKSDIAKAMNKAEASAVYRKYEGKINKDDAAKLGAARMNEIKVMEIKQISKEISKEIIEVENVVGSDLLRPKTIEEKAPEQKADDLKDVIEEALETKLIDIEVKDNKPIKGNKNAK